MRLKQAGIFRRLWWWVTKQLRRRAKVTRIAEAVLPARKVRKRRKAKWGPIGWIVQTWGPNRHERRALAARARHHDEDLRVNGRYRRRTSNAGNR